MSNPTRRDRMMQVKCATLAYHFANGCTNAHDLADLMQTRQELIRRWYARQDFHDALDALGYTGSREFTRRRRDVTREQPAYATAIELYASLEQQGVPERERIAEVAKLLGNQYSKQRIAAWIKRHKETTD